MTYDLVPSDFTQISKYIQVLAPAPEGRLYFKVDRLMLEIKLGNIVLASKL